MSTSPTTQPPPGPPNSLSRASRTRQRPSTCSAIGTPSTATCSLGGRKAWGLARSSSPVLRRNLGRRQVVDLSALIRRESQLDDHPLAPPSSTPPVPLRRPSPARPREPGLAPPTRRVQEDGTDRKSVV